MESSPANGTEQSHPEEMRLQTALLADALDPRYTVDQVWCHCSDEGEQWLLLRLAAPLNTPTTQSQLVRKPARLLAAAKVSVAFDTRPALLRQTTQMVSPPTRDSDG
jgi:hypothetical protein